MLARQTAACTRLRLEVCYCTSMSELREKAMDKELRSLPQKSRTLPLPDLRRVPIVYTHNRKYADQMTGAAKHDTRRHQMLANAMQKTMEKDTFVRVDDEDDDGSVEFTPFVVAKHSPLYYKELCRRLAGEGKIAEAVAVVEKRMVEDRVRPEKFNYITVIHILARAGQARKAMEFFRKIRTAGYQPGPHTITSLMNACANAPIEDAEFALQQTKWLFKREKHLYGIPKTPAIYFAAMKCFAKHGDVESLFKIVDEMVEDGWYAGNRIFAYLLSAALSDKESGFLLALQVWRTMKQLSLPIELSHYQLLIRICRECGLGEKGNVLLGKIIEKKKLERFSATETCQMGPSYSKISQQTAAAENGIIGNDDRRQLVSSNDTVISPTTEVPSRSVLDPIALQERNIKLSLLGGYGGLLEQMRLSKVQPDLKFFSSLLFLLPNNAQQEATLIKSMSEMNVSPDVEFFNQLIYRRAKRNDSEGALSCLDDIRRHKLTLDYRTFVALSMMCRSSGQSLTLLRDMEASSFAPNLDIFRNFVKSAFYKRFNFVYARTLLRQMSKFHVQPDAVLLTLLETKLAEARKVAVKSKYAEQDSTANASTPTIWGLDEFIAFYDDWLKNMKVLNPKSTLLKKVVNVDDLRENWEKPWLQDEMTRNKQSLDDNIEIVPSKLFQ